MLGSRVNTVAEREERVRSHHGTADLETLVRCLDRRDLCRVDAAHLPGADADRHVILAEDDGIGLDVFDDGPGKQHVFDLPGRRRLLGHDLEVGFGNHAMVARLHQQAAGDLFEIKRSGIACRRGFSPEFVRA